MERSTCNWMGSLFFENEEEAKNSGHKESSYSGLQLNKDILAKAKVGE